MRGAQVRGAGGLLVGVTVQPITSALSNTMRYPGHNMFESLRDVFWAPSGVTPPGDMVPFLVLRAVLVFGGLALGVVGLAGVRAVRYPIAVVSALLVVGIFPWVIWPYDPVAFRHQPPEWVLEHPLWFLSGRPMAIAWIAMLVAALVFAMIDRPMQPAPAFGPAYGTTPPWDRPAGPTTGPWAPPGAPAPPAPGPGSASPGAPAPPAPGPGSGSWPVPAPGDAPPPPAPSPQPAGDAGPRRPPTPF